MELTQFKLRNDEVIHVDMKLELKNIKFIL